MLRPRGHRPSGREHERAHFSLECPLGAYPRTGFRQVPLTPRLDDRKYDEAKQVSGETRSDRDWYPRVGRDGSPEKWPMRKSQADEVLRGVW